MNKDTVVVLFLKHELNTLCLCKPRAISFPVHRLAKTSDKNQRHLKNCLMECFVAGLSKDLLRFLIILSVFPKSQFF